MSRLVPALACAAAAVAAAAAPVPQFSPAPDPARPLAGYPLVPGATHTIVFNATPAGGTYNHAAMLDYFGGSFLLTWKNSPVDEDSPGQRVLFSQSADGIAWTPAGVLFPNVSTSSNPAALFAEPALHLRGRLYAAASPKQFCLYPDQYAPLLLLRRVLVESGGPLPSGLGPLFWASPLVPPGFEAASAALGILTVNQTDATTQGDVAVLADPGVLPCGPATPGVGTTKCEACAGGCQLWPTAPPIVNERTHYTLPPGNASDGIPDVLLYRTGENRFYFSVRTAAGGAWSDPSPSDIPDDNSNLHAGALPDGRRFLMHNPLKSAAARDPLTVATSTDGWAFGGVAVALTCTALPPNYCTPRFAGKYKNPGPSYPQAVALVPAAAAAAAAAEGRGGDGAAASGPAPGLWFTATVNKEDVWVGRLPYGSF